MDNNIKKLTEIISSASEDNRNYLYEHEVYKILNLYNFNLPQYKYINKNEELNPIFDSDKYVIKAVAKDLFHKTEVGAIKVNVLKEQINETIKEMTKNIDGIVGFIVAEQVAFINNLGHEWLFGLQYDQAFGYNLTIGAGGIHTNLFYEEFKKDRANVILPLEFSSDMDKDQIFDFFKKACQKLLPLKFASGKTRDKKPYIDESNLFNIYSAFLNLKQDLDKIDDFIIEEMEMNPVVISNNSFVALDGLLRFKNQKHSPRVKDISKIGNLLRPNTVGIVGVSTKRKGFANIILDNLIRSGNSLDSFYILHPQKTSISGITTLQSIDEIKTKAQKKLDLFVVAASSKGSNGSSAHEIINQIIDHDLAHSIMIISAGFDETEQGEEASKKIKEKIAATPNVVINGPNTVGNFYGSYDTIFTPMERSSCTGEGVTNVGIICQSGAFMITRISDLANKINPRLSVSVGNQLDLSVADILSYTVEDPDIDTFGLYIEGFNPLDGKKLLEIFDKYKNKQFLLYKAGRSKIGADAVKGHTASMGGNYEILRQLTKYSNVVLVENFEDFNNVLYFMAYNKKIDLKTTPCLAAMSNAGYERCAIADLIEDDEGNSLFQIPSYSEETVEKVKDIYHQSRIADFMDVHDIVDLTPMANDKIYYEVSKALLSDPSADMGLISIVPETNSLKAGDDYKDETSVSNYLLKLKDEVNVPFCVVVESGIKFDRILDYLNKNGICVFRSVSEAMRTLKLYSISCMK